MADLNHEKSSNSDSNYEEIATPTKRILRNRKKPKKFGDFLDIPIEKNVTQRSEDNSSDSDESNGDQHLLKPNSLFSNDDVDGQDMFKFKSRHTKHDLRNKVNTALSNSSLVIDSISNLSPFHKGTPRHVKNIIKKRIIREVESDSTECDFSASSSDFIPEESDSETETSSGKDSDEELAEELTNKIKISQSAEVNKTRSKDNEYIVTPDNYFMMHSTKKITTSDHTLARLKNLNNGENFQKAGACLSDEHNSRIIDLSKTYKNLFDRWLFVLSENFNLILYGIGTKRKVLEQFQKEKLQDFHCIVVNGFFPSLTIKSILETIVVDLLENTHVPSNIGEVVNIIDTQLTEAGAELFLIIHNIDGLMLRNSKTQAILANISQINNVHTIATIDHINAPLLWDHSKLSKFKFTWWDVTTFMPYTDETSFENSLITQKSGALQLSSLNSVYQSLTTNARGIFNIIIKYQLENYKRVHYQGLLFKELYSKCREQFLVSSDIALRAQLTEFLDHKLIKMKRTYDGSENLIIPIENSLLQQFLEQQS